MNLNSQKNDLILLILEYLYNSNLINSYIALENETSLSLFNYNKELSFLRKLILDGKWEKCENFLTPLKVQNNFDFKEAILSIKMQKFLEATENEVNIDQSDLEKQLNEIKLYCSKETFSQILKLLDSNSIKDNEKYKNWTTISGRLECFEKIRKLMNVIYPINNINEKKLKNNLLEKTLSKIAGSGKDLVQGMSNYISQSNIRAEVKEDNSKQQIKINQQKNKISAKPVSSSKIEIESKNKQPANSKILEPVIPPLSITAPIQNSNYNLFSYDPTSFYLGALLVDPQPIRASSFNPKGDHLVIGTNSRSLKIYDMSALASIFSSNNKKNNQEPSPSLPLLFEKANHHQGSIYTLDWSKTGKLIASGSNDKIIKIIVSPEINSTNILELQIPGHKGTVRSVMFLPEDEHTLLSGGTVDTNIFIWDTETGKQKGSLLGHSSDIHSIKSSIINSSNLIASCEKENIINFWDIRNNQIQNSLHLKKHSNINDISFTSSFVVAAHSDGFVSVVDYSNNEIIKEIKVSDKAEIRSVNISGDGKYILCGGFDHKMKIYDICNDFNQVKTMEHEDRVVSCKWHPDLPIIVSTSADKTARLWIPKIL